MNTERTIKSLGLAVTFAVTFCVIAAKEPGVTAQEVKFGLLAQAVIKDNALPVFPDGLKKLEGTHVRISGFVMPYDDPKNLQKMILLETPGGCFFCSPPNINTVVFVRCTPQDRPREYSPEPVVVEGTLHLWHADMKEDDEARQFLFTIDDAKANALRH